LQRRRRSGGTKRQSIHREEERSQQQTRRGGRKGREKKGGRKTTREWRRVSPPSRTRKKKASNSSGRKKEKSTTASQRAVGRCRHCLETALRRKVEFTSTPKGKSDCTTMTRGKKKAAYEGRNNPGGKGNNTLLWTIPGGDPRRERGKVNHFEEIFARKENPCISEKRKGVRNPLLFLEKRCASEKGESTNSLCCLKKGRRRVIFVFSKERKHERISDRMGGWLYFCIRGEKKYRGYSATEGRRKIRREELVHS